METYLLMLNHKTFPIGLVIIFELANTTNFYINLKNASYLFQIYVARTAIYSIIQFVIIFYFGSAIKSARKAVTLTKSHPKLNKYVRKRQPNICLNYHYSLPRSLVWTNGLLVSIIVLALKFSLENSHELLSQHETAVLSSQQKK